MRGSWRDANVAWFVFILCAVEASVWLGATAAPLKDQPNGQLLLHDRLRNQAVARGTQESVVMTITPEATEMLLAVGKHNTRETHGSFFPSVATSTPEKVVTEHHPSMHTQRGGGNTHAMANDEDADASDGAPSAQGGKGKRGSSLSVISLATWNGSLNGLTVYGLNLLVVIAGLAGLSKLVQHATIALEMSSNKPQLHVDGCIDCFEMMNEDHISKDHEAAFLNEENSQRQMLQEAIPKAVSPDVAKSKESSPQPRCRAVSAPAALTGHIAWSMPRTCAHCHGDLLIGSSTFVAVDRIFCSAACRSNHVSDVADALQKNATNPQNGMRSCSSYATLAALRNLCREEL